MGCYADAPVILRGRDMASCGYLDDAYVVIDGGVVEAFGPMNGYKMQESGNYVIDASERYVMPAFCDSHTHIVYAGSREGEYEDRIAGMSYAQIAERGGGILNSADRLHASTENELYRSAMRRVREMMRGGTGAGWATSTASAGTLWCPPWRAGARSGGPMRGFIFCSPFREGRRQVRGLSEYCLREKPFPGTLVLGFAGLPQEQANRAVGDLRKAFEM